MPSFLVPTAARSLKAVFELSTVKGAEEISHKIAALEDKISSMPASTEPSPEAGMNIMRKAVAKNDLTKLKNRRTRITRPGRSK